jgi:protein-tyrosine phosphatase
MSHDPAESAVAHARILEAFHSAHTAGEKVVVHCRGGQSRTGLALSSWLVAHHGLSAHEAAEEVLAQAQAAQVVRFADAKKIAAFTGTT